MRVRIAVKLLTVAVFAVCAVAQTVSAGVVAGTFVTYDSTNSGLPSNSVRAIVIDGSSRLWFGTDNGLARFDGTNWKLYTTGNKLPSSVVTALAYEVNSTYGQEIWIGTDNGASVVRADGSTCATPYRTTNINYPGMISNKITSVVVDSQHVRWFGSENGLMSFDGDSWKSYTTDSTGVKLADNYINAIAYEETSNGPEIWVATNNGISVIKTKIDAMSYATPYRTTNSNYPGMNSNLIVSALVDTVHNARWFGTDKGAIRFKDNAFQSYEFGSYGFLPDDPDTVTALAVNPVDSTNYFGTYNYGVGRYDGVSSASFLDTNWSYIASNNIRAITVAPNGVVWFATDSGVTKWIPDSKVDEPNAQPIPIALKGNYPNPFNPSTSIEFTLNTRADVSLYVYNAAGQRIRELASGSFPAGMHTAVWDGKDRNGMAVSSGTYFAQLHSGNVTINRKMLLLK